ncbi:uncharacterized protein LOC110443114 [Mizuhopecten yessoensis]|uniref:uncharacterized protein LOC110443114 n=1 Tax=Mizuhopecten yessoensis TaxID=6573 RepID=UPI000B45B775|nr:uncharacterized protein LOC110443114 [Mizuhopecten yessoensis]
MVPEKVETACSTANSCTSVRLPDTLHLFWRSMRHWKGIKGIAGDVKSVKPLGSGDLLIEVFHKQQAINLLGTTSFGSISVIVKAHPSLNSSKGVIRCLALRNDADAAILEYFHEEEIPVSEVRRILSKKNNKLVPTDTFVLTFATPSLPSAVVIGYQRCNVSVYIPNPLRCRNCQKYGHHEKRCRRKTVCQYCGREGYEDQSDCDIANLRCVNCEGKHAASSQDCPAWNHEREILQVKFTRNVSFPEARRIVESTDVAAPSYAQVTKVRSPVDSVAVKDASVQVSADIPAWGSQVPDMSGQDNLKILTGDPSRFTSIRKPTKNNKQSKAASPSKPASSSKPRSRSLTSVPRSQLRPEATSPTNRPRKKIRIARGKSEGPDLNVTFGKGSEDPTNRFNVLLDFDDEMETNASALRASTPSKSSQNSKR